MKRLLIISLLLGGCANGTDTESAAEADLAVRAEKLAHDFVIVDTHIDVPYRLHEEWADISLETDDGEFDYPRAMEGGLDAAFMSIYVPAEKQEVDGLAAAFADSMIDMVEGFVIKDPEKFAIATSPDQVRMHHAVGILSLPMGMENGAPITDMDKLQHFYDRGIRYITLTHAEVNRISDSSYDTTRAWNGLSPFGEDVVKEMNRLGIMVDISHVTDSAFYDVMAVTEAPAIASHSSCRYFTPGWERNMSDDMIMALAENGGVIQINFGSSFLSTEAREYQGKAWDEIRAYLEENGIDRDSEEGKSYIAEYRKEHPYPYADVTDVADHIDHVVELVGIDHVGLGSDYDGVGDSLPAGLKDVSDYPNLVKVLLERGYSDFDIEKVLGGNLLRVWEEVEAVAAQKQAA